ncbi:MAG: 3-hydroxyacyl-CoA dehydrogenase/enoyl-CoA hydratase family protein [Balneolaceae bacterium]|nr:3-hydroxyacyl-CoA dehydrogenase/enoyl-CoA hydratase family protein [Balneolaceae bacterium]
MPDKSNSIQKVVVLGSGTMGSQIAAHCVNAGLQVTLLDLKEEGDRPSRRAEENIEKLTESSPAPLALPELASRITPGNFEDHLDGALAEADWICEAIIEKMDVKRQMMARIQKHRRPGSIVSSNTSGLPIAEIGSECSDELQAHFLGTHFFNPPRYMKLLELIPTGQTDPEVTARMKRFCERTLGKGVVVCRDTPNFIANRIGIFSMASVMPRFFDGDFRAEEIDYLLGTLTGYSKAAIFRTADMSGLDVISHVCENLYPAVPDDERREVFKLPEAFGRMVEEGHMGNKAGKGFYKKVRTDGGKEYRVVDPDTLDYESQTDPQFKEADQARKKASSAAERLRLLVSEEGRVGDFLWETQADQMLYAARRMPEIADSPADIDRAMKWGFNWELGPFERWDAIGVREAAERMEKDGREVPDSITRMLDIGRETFYDRKEGTVWNLAIGEAEPLQPPAEGSLRVADLRREGRAVWEDEHAALYDMGEGIALFEFRTRKQTLGFGLIQALQKACDTVREAFDGLVIGHDGDNFTYGANLMEAAQAWKSGEKERVREAARRFQETAVGLRYQPFPVVAAPFGRTLGGGVEFILHADRIVAHHELYAGMVEAGVGLLPAGGGTKEMLRRTMERVLEDEQTDPLPYIREIFKTLGMAKVSDSAAKAREMGFLHDADTMVMNRDLLLIQARAEARRLADRGYRPPAPPKIPVQGRKGLASLKLMLYMMHEGGWITDYDRVVGEKIAEVLSGGDLSEPQEVPEQYLLRLEREAFMELLEDERTMARIEHMLETGKPLRN